MQGQMATRKPIPAFRGNNLPHFTLFCQGSNHYQAIAAAAAASAGQAIKEDEEGRGSACIRHPDFLKNPTLLARLVPVFVNLLGRSERCKH